ncbi:XRE family transcriptional regulator [Streptacidiphilus sp. N1-3]|uniref:XRE family transcriptional regulator n=1 Tax=Streptacidiphilus alkalitolerans TaxID=3342712 RepID=A0ABV6XAT3_9ACTN
MSDSSVLLDAPQSPDHLLGTQLRNLRKAMPGKPSHKALGALVLVSGSLIGRIEDGSRKCLPDLAQRLDEVMGTDGVLYRMALYAAAESDKRRRESDRHKRRQKPVARSDGGQGILGGEAALTASDGSPLDRRSFITAAGVTALAPGVLRDLVANLEIRAPRTSVHTSDIDEIHSAAAVLKTLDGRHGGGGIVRQLAVTQLKDSLELIQVCPQPLRGSLFTAVGRLSVVIGQSAFDTYAHADARRVFELATTCAEEANDWGLRGYAYSWRSRQETWCGDADRGLTYAELGLARADRLTPTEQAWLLNAKARALAKMGRVQETLAAVGASDEAFARAVPGAERPWMSFYDQAQHAGDTGHAWFDIALVTGNPTEPIARLQSAVDHHGAGYVRSRALSRTKLATLQMRLGDPQEASQSALTALDEVGHLRSRRAADDLRSLYQVTTPHKHSDDVAHLRQRIKTTLESA